MSYWVHVTAEAVKSTGKGAKILVPAANTIDAAHRNALLAVAATARPASTWEGSAWTGARQLAPADLLRHALLVPRLVAPHRNAGRAEAPGPEQIVALIVEGRIRDVGDFTREHDSLPTRAQAADSPLWIWRFTAALGNMVMIGTIDHLPTLIDDAPTSGTRAAATVVAADALLRHGRPDQALDLLNSTLDTDRCTPVDHAWLTLQRARALVDIGDINQARVNAEHAARIRLSHADDPTATAIGGTAAVLLFLTADLLGRPTRPADDQQGRTGTVVAELEAAITGMDTTAAWWRTERVATGAVAALQRQFTSWTMRNPLGFSDDVANNKLHTASLLAGLLGDHDTWRRLDSLNIQQTMLTFDRTTEVKRVRRLLSELRLDGDNKTLEAAAARFVTDGPSAAVTAAATEIDFTHWTHTTTPSTLALLRSGGDVLDQATATAAVDWLLDTITDPRAFTTRTRPGFDARERLIVTLAHVLAAAPEDRHSTIVDTVLALPPQDDQLTAMRWREVVKALPSTVWTPRRAAQATHAAASHQDTLGLALIQAAAAVDTDARQLLLDDILGEDPLTALAGSGNLRVLPPAVASSVITRLGEHVESAVGLAPTGVHLGGTGNTAHALTVLNLNHPRLARWEPIYTLLNEPNVEHREKQATSETLAHPANHLPTEVKQHLVPIVEAMLTHPATVLDRFHRQPTNFGIATQLLANLDDDPTRIHDLLPNLLTGSTEQRQRATHLTLRLDPATATGILIPLIGDPAPAVRADAAATLADLVARGVTTPLTLTMLKHSLADPGTSLREPSRSYFPKRAPRTTPVRY